MIILKYVSVYGGINLPDPLDQETLCKYFLKMRNGDETAKDIIAKHNIKLVIGMVSYYFKSNNWDMDELVSIGTIGLMKSIDAFDPNKGNKFSTYASECIRNEILMFLKKQVKRSEDISLEESIVDGDNSAVKVGDLLVATDDDPVENYEEKELYMNVRKYVENLPDRERQIVTMIFGFNSDEPVTQKEIALSLGMSQSQVSRVLKATLEQAKNHFSKEYVGSNNARCIVKTSKHH